MQINYLGHSSFRIKSGGSALLTDPFDPKEVGLPYPKVSADIVTISNNNKDHNDVSRLKEPAFIIDSPGEYEIKNFFVTGLNSFCDKEQTCPNNIFIIEAEGIRLCHLGDLAVSLDDKQVDQIGGVDVLFFPVGQGTGAKNSVSESLKLINQFEPSIAIPMHYQQTGMAEKWGFLPTLENFLNEFGAASEKLDKLVIAKTDLPEETKLIILDKKQTVERQL